MVKPGGFETLPHDILDLILTEVRNADFATICELRLVSRAINEAAEPKVFESMTINLFSEFWQNRSPDRLMALASSPGGHNPNARWTKQLTIPYEGLVAPGINHSTPDSRDHEEMLTYQERYLVPAILGLRNLRRARYDLCGTGPYEDVLPALAQLERLEDLTIEFFDANRIFENPKSPSLLPLFNFHSLRVLKLYGFPLCAPMISAITHLISHSESTLQTLILLPAEIVEKDGPPEPDEMYIDEIFDHPENQYQRDFTDPSKTLEPSGLVDRKRLPKLSKLLLNGERFKLRDLTVPFFHSLVHLEIKNRSVPNLNAEPSFWAALTGAAIHLEYLAVYPVTHALVSYLTSYRGLKELHLRCNPADPQEFADLELPVPLFTQVLPWQCKTLRRLSFVHLRWEAWALREEYLEGILQCGNLESLCLIYYYPPPPTESEGEEAGQIIVGGSDSEVDDKEKVLKPVALPVLLNRICEKLQKLQLLVLALTHSKVSPSSTGSELAIAKDFSDSVCGARIVISARAIPTFTLIPLLASGFSFSSLKFIFDTSTGYFKEG